jgi:transcriptional regulator with XRE-family HTH domain
MVKEYQPMEDEIGRKIRSRRKAMRLSLVELGGRAGCSPSYLSMVENGKVNPSLSRMKRITEGLGITINDLFREDQQSNTVIRRHERKRNEIPELKMAGEILVPDLPGRQMDARLFIIHPGGKSDGIYHHQGQEFGLVLEGSFELIVDHQTYYLNAGDSFYFSSEKTHGFHNPNDRDAVVVWVNQTPGH